MPTFNWNSSPSPPPWSEILYMTQEVVDTVGNNKIRFHVYIEGSKTTLAPLTIRPFSGQLDQREEHTVYLRTRTVTTNTDFDFLNLEPPPNYYGRCCYRIERSSAI